MCDVGKCKRQSEITYAAFGSGTTKEVSVCWRHWEKHCDDEDKFDLRVHFYPPKGGKKDV